jgi:hypothetical protein
MRSEVFHIRNREICCEVYESELKLDGHDKEPITILTFALGSFSIDALMEMGGHLWVEVGRRYLNLKKAFPEKSSAEVIGRISFECDDTRVEYEFSKLTKSTLLSLCQIGPFLKQYPCSQEIRIARDGPTLVHFRNSEPETSSERPAGADSAAIHSWFSAINGRMRRYFRRRP